MKRKKMKQNRIKRRKRREVELRRPKKGRWSMFIEMDQ
jgi:hypothetical protein